MIASKLLSMILNSLKIKLTLAGSVGYAFINFVDVGVSGSKIDHC